MSFPHVFITLLLFSTITNDHYFTVIHGTKWPLRADVHLSNHSFIHSFQWELMITDLSKIVFTRRPGMKTREATYSRDGDGKRIVIV